MILVVRSLFEVVKTSCVLTTFSERVNWLKLHKSGEFKLKCVEWGMEVQKVCSVCGFQVLSF